MKYERSGGFYLQKVKNYYGINVRLSILFWHKHITNLAFFNAT